jgi:hypothetical protein
LKSNYAGCAICDSTWGDRWADVEGERLFFCCDVCERQFRELVARIEAETGWGRIDAVEISGDRRGRTCRASKAGENFECVVAFNAEGAIREFHRRAGPRA